MPGRQSGVSGETCRSGEAGRSQSLHSTDAASAVRGAASKTAPREGRQEVGGAKSGMRQQAASGVPEKATQGAEARRQWWWTEASIWTERMVSALGNGVKGGKWYSLMDKVVRPTTLETAWRKVARNQGAAGADGQSIERFAAQAERYLQELQLSLVDGSYRPHPVKRVEIAKGDGRTRPLGIPTVKDRIVQTALKMVIEPIFETQFRPGSYGFRPGRSCKDALREVDRLLKAGFTWVVDADLQGYFDSIPHDRLMTLVKGSISDRPVVGGGLEAQDKCELVVHLDRRLAETVLDARAFDAGGQPAADFLSQLRGDLVAKKGGDVFGFDIEHGLTGELLIKRGQHRLRAEDQIGGIFDLH
jgi:hypothetical protein